VGKADHKYGTSPGRRFMKIFDNHRRSHPDHWAWLAGNIATVSESYTVQLFD
jgi:hypothetical protein